MTTANPLLGAATQITGATGLDFNSAYTLLMYCGITHVMPKLKQCPILVLRGPTETGKTTSMYMGSELSYNVTATVAQPTPAILRDIFTLHSTVLIEEADGIDESLLTNRYSMDNPRKVNRNVGNGVYISGDINLMGATLLHRRRPFKDPATESRCITLNTKAKSGIVRYASGSLIPFLYLLEVTSNNFPYNQVHTMSPGRSEYNWGLLKMFAAQIYTPPDWLTFVDEQIQYSQETTVQGRDEEPINKVWSALTRLTVVAHEDITKAPLLVARRITLASLTKELNREEGAELYNPWEVGQIIRQVGFKVESRGGVQTIIVNSLASIIQAGQKLGVSDELCQYTV